MSGADDFVDKANQIVKDVVERGREVRPDYNAVIDQMMARKAKQTVETLDKVIQVSNTRTEKRPTMIFVVTADALQEKELPHDVDLTISDYTDLSKVSPAARFRVKAELGHPLFCKVEWLRERLPQSGYSAPAVIEGETPNGVASSIILFWKERGEGEGLSQGPYRSPEQIGYRTVAPGVERVGVTLLAHEGNPDGWAMMYPGAVLSVHEGAEVVAKVTLSMT